MYSNSIQCLLGNAEVRLTTVRTQILLIYLFLLLVLTGCCEHQRIRLCRYLVNQWFRLWDIERASNYFIQIVSAGK